MNQLNQPQEQSTQRFHPYACQIYIYILMQLRKKNQQKFSIQELVQQENPEEYLSTALIRTCGYKTINPNCMSISELEILLSLLTINLQHKQLHELYLLSTKINHKNSDNRILGLVNNRKTEISLSIVAKWVVKKLKNKKAHNSIFNFHVRAQSGHIPFSRKDKKFALMSPSRPVIQFKNQVKEALQIFQEMEKSRQNVGLLPVSIDSEDDDPEKEPVRNIHYDADFHQANQKLFKLKTEAQKRINSIIQCARIDTKLNKTLQKSIEKYRRIRTQANEKIGRFGAMKAQKRMIDKRKAEVNALDKWRSKHNLTQQKIQ